MRAGLIQAFMAELELLQVAQASISQCDHYVAHPGPGELEVEPKISSLVFVI